MCTATSWNTNAAEFAKRFPQYDPTGVSDYRRLMIRPTEMQVTCLNDGRKQLHLHPFGTKLQSPGKPRRTVVNARRENLTRSPLWSKLMGRNRCLVFVSAFYECRHTSGAMEVFRIAEIEAGKPAPVSALAALQTTEGGVVVVTRPAEAGMEDIHARMPALLAPDRFDAWLHASQGDAMDLLALPPVPLGFTRITPKAFTLSPSSPALLEAVEAPQPPPGQQELF